MCCDWPGLLLCSDWFLGLSACVVIGRGYYFVLIGSLDCLRVL